MTPRFTRQHICDTIQDSGWRYLLGELRTQVLTDSLARSAEVATHAVAACAPHADGHLRLDLRADRVLLALHTPEDDFVTQVDLDLAARISGLARALGLRTEPGTPVVQAIELGIDALDIAAVRPFWKAVLGFRDAPGQDNALIDPVRQAPAVWFQQMDAPRPQRNRIHFDVSVPHEEAPARVEAALAAGGVLVSDQWAPSFWVLADPEGNEACVCTWQGRD
jgi:4a-hydroxytetrahydrobiopterin dehydratase